MRTNSCSKNVLDRSGKPDIAGSYKKALAARKLLNVKDTHSNRHLYGKTTQLKKTNREIMETKIVASSHKRIIEAKSN
jgi:hypothetical protein